MELSKFVGNKIKYYRELRGMTQTEIAQKLSTTRQTISRYENGERKANQDILFDLSDILGVSINDFFPETKEKMDIFTIYDRLNEERKTKVYNYAQNHLDEQNNIIHIDEYKEIYIQSKVSAGTGILDLEPDHAEPIQYKGKLPNYYDLAFVVAGNSMVPTFFDKDIIFVEKMSEVINGALMVVQIDEQAYIKKVYKENSHLRLVSLNKEYKDIIVDGNNEVRIVGKVVF